MHACVLCKHIIVHVVYMHAPISTCACIFMHMHICLSLLSSAHRNVLAVPSNILDLLCAGVYFYVATAMQAYTYTHAYMYMYTYTHKIYYSTKKHSTTMTYKTIFLIFLPWFWYSYFL